MSPLELRIEELRHHMKIESAVMEGAKNAIKLLQNTKSQDKKALQEVSAPDKETKQHCSVVLRPDCKANVHPLLKMHIQL